MGGYGIVNVHGEGKLTIMSKGKTAEGANDVLTKADLVSNQIILDVLGRYPGLNVRLLCYLRLVCNISPNVA